MDEDEEYEIVDCNPDIDAGELTVILRELNHSEDMSLLVRHMRECVQACAKICCQNFLLSLVELNATALSTFLFLPSIGRAFQNTCH